MLITSLAAALAAAAIQAPIAQVTVYSDRARIVRTAEVPVEGTAVVDLPLLDDSVDASTIQLEASGAQVQKIDLSHVDEQEFPRDEARDLLESIEALDDRVAKVNADRAARQAQLQALQRISPNVKEDALKPPPKLHPEGWAAALEFVEAEQDKLETAQRAGAEALRALSRERDKLAHRAAQIGAQQRRTGHRVRATLKGNGTARLKLTYMATNARWFPSYDVQFLADKGEALVAFAGQVSQETGEDWVDANITLSTAIPSSSRALPKLLSWKIGEKERFIPTPAPQPAPPVPPAPPAPPPAPLPRPRADRLDDDQLRQKLAVFASRSLERDGAASESDSMPSFEAGEGGVSGVVGGGGAAALGMPPSSPPPPANRRGVSKKKAKRDFAQKGEVESKMAAPKAQSAPRAAGPMPAMEMPARAELAAKPSAPPAAQVGLAPPPAYVPPSFSAELPAAQAGGYDLSFPALRKETIKTGEGVRRVPLLVESWPVKAERVVYPALAPDAAFLVAEIKNSSDRVLPGGPAALAVGNDPAGQAQLKLVSPGETFTLPLGLDRAIKPIRNVNVVTEEKGLFGKSEVTSYSVTIELSNPYRQPVPVRVVDQVPLQANKDAELKIERMTPAPSKQDKETGRLEWALTLPASGKQTVVFVYSLRRPKGYRLYQEQ